MQYKKVEDYLYGLRNRGSKWGIERMVRFSQALGNPHHKTPCIHVAGTNGKGSTCAMLEAIFRQAGYRTGLFTSPHLVLLGERIQCNRQLITRQQIAAYVEKMKPIADHLAKDDPQLHPTFFEFMTAMAFLHFAEHAVDIAIIETGLGGRLDSTNVVTPLASVITSIALDHTDLLGNTLPAIAKEKAGIIKNGVPVIMGPLPDEAQAVVKTVAQNNHSMLLQVELDHSIKTNLKGRFQKINASIAQATAQCLMPAFPQLKAHTITTALQSIEWNGRWQCISLTNNRQLILDATHNAQGAEMLHENLKAWCQEHNKFPIVLLGVLGKERAQDIIDVVTPYAKQIRLFQPNQPRACTVDVLKSLIPETYSGEVIESTIETSFDANNDCLIGERDEHILATGSIYFMGELSQKLFYKKATNESFLQDKL